MNTPSRTKTPTRSRHPERPSQDQAGANAGGPGPFSRDLHRTPPVLWASVALMCLGAALVGGGAIALSRSLTLAVVLFIAGAVVGGIGLVLGLRNRIMTNVD